MRHFQLSLIALLVLVLAIIPLAGCTSNGAEGEQLQSRIAQLEQENTALAGRIIELEEQLAEKEVVQDITSLESALEELRNDYDTLKTTFDKLQIDYNALLTEVEKSSLPTSTPTPTTPTIPTSETPQGLSNAEYLFDNSASIISWDTQPAFLGIISNKYDNDSILNKYGSYGSKYADNSIWNKYGNYGGKYSDYSPFNRYTSNPPKIYIGDTFWGYLSTSKYLSTNTLNPNDLLMFAYLKYDDESYLELMIN